ncbi:AI-2E family transporter [Phreatobacter aquaticus]|uniref:AI-2E family transporter n=2 Tax=Phreatobacter aquaticus TaxID=2570229 RepID=A0A4D7QLL8_9HYPH|nr:AI-2E family transporter [Phreatobacter aquaticus]
MRSLEDAAFLILVVALSALLAWILWPYYGAILWAVVAAIVFAPVQARLNQSFGGRTSLAALATLLLIIALVIVPFILIGAALVPEAASAYAKFQSGELDLVRALRRVVTALPAWASNLLDDNGLTSLGAIQRKLVQGLASSSGTVASHALSIGQGTFGFIVNLGVMLYLLFFLLRDGGTIAGRFEAAFPIDKDRKRALLEQFTVVVQATIKGSILVALIQGALGGLIFWALSINAPLLWAVAMAFLSLLPSVGAGIVWLPVAIYLLATGAVWQGAVLIAFGVLVIGLVDNALRPILVGKDTRMPDYVVLLSTLGGLEMFGLNGFVVGPVIAAMAIVAWDIFIVTRRDASDAAGETEQSST